MLHESCCHRNQGQHEPEKNAAKCIRPSPGQVAGGAPGDSQLERHLRKGAGVRACPRTLALVRHDRIRGGQEFTVFFLKEGRAPPSLLPALQSLEGQRAFHKAERARE